MLKKTLIESLLEIAAPLSCELPQIDNPDSDRPDWEWKRFQADWQRYIDPSLHSLWPTLSREARLVAFIMAKDAQRTGEQFIRD